jgi:transcriptional regulator with XRE-family HTH domain
MEPNLQLSFVDVNYRLRQVSQGFLSFPLVTKCQITYVVVHKRPLRDPRTIGGRVPSDFARALSGVLAERRIKQAALARRLDVTPQAVSSWVLGSSTPSRDNVVRLEDELAVEPRGWLLDLAGYSADGQIDQTPESLIRGDPGLDPEDKRVLLRMLMLARERHKADKGLVQPLG